MTPETRLIAALDLFRDALADYLVARTAETPAPAALLTVSEAAREMGVARSSATRWVESGDLPVQIIDGRRWVRRSDIDRLGAR